MNTCLLLLKVEANVRVFVEVFADAAAEDNNVVVAAADDVGELKQHWHFVLTKYNIMTTTSSRS